MKISTQLIIALLIVSLVFASGCITAPSDKSESSITGRAIEAELSTPSTSEQIKYVCADGTTVSDASLCPKQETYIDEECIEIEPKYDIQVVGSGLSINRFGDWIVTLEIKNMEDVPITLNVTVTFDSWVEEFEKLMKVGERTEIVKLNPYETREVEFYSLIPSSKKVSTFGQDVDPTPIKECK